jgi:hypothetical protein
MQMDNHVVKIKPKGSYLIQSNVILELDFAWNLVMGRDRGGDKVTIEWPVRHIFSDTSQ